MGRKRKPNEYSFTEDYVKIHCNDCDFIIDVEDFEKVKQFRWFSKFSFGNYYAYSHLKGNKKIILHRFIMNVDDKTQFIDHKDGNTLNNRKTNLRLASKLENNRNAKKRKNSSSIYKGVTKRPSGRWGVYIQINNKATCLGTYDSEIEAAKVYNKFALTYFKEFARINVIKEK